jgi:tetratricopeptide (TPR) repeat protein
MTFAGNNPEAIRLLGESIDLLATHRRDAYDQRIPATRMNLAQAMWNDHQDEKAADLLYQTLSEWRDISNPLATAVCLNNLAAAEISLGRNTDAWRHARECLRIRRQIGAVGSYAWSFNIIGILAADNGDLRVAAQLFGAASFINETRPNARTPREHKIVDDKVAEVERLLGTQVFSELVATGGKTELDSMVDMALSCGPGFLEWTDQ